MSSLGFHHASHPELPGDSPSQLASAPRQLRHQAEQQHSLLRLSTRSWASRTTASRAGTPPGCPRQPRIVGAFDDLSRKYPESHGKVYRNCWLRTRALTTPQAFYDNSWLSEMCTRQNSYGYEESGGYYSPCFILRLEKTADWVPRFTDFVPSEISDHYDPSFTPVLCFVKKTRGLATLPNLQVYPPKGFSHLFFPVSKFDPALYLPPMVAVKLTRVPRAVNVTVGARSSLPMPTCCGTTEGPSSLSEQPESFCVTHSDSED
ncbi:uncharacterized protein CEXT_587161 [Caerostris extrusa]|uniref:Uncharacterized protein n=1 Tax=Caerostris extrusa TaxID=172846 RepID=A0AAV4XSE5_CAEEX|nr:uncharacterized protein CEXT_587161 [Caerostris extrusa]